jgi:membrane associated rhomboid family serine protease
MAIAGIRTPFYLFSCILSRLLLLPLSAWCLFLRTICASCDSAVICCPQLGCSGAVCAWFAYWRFALCVQKTTQASLKAEY